MVGRRQQLGQEPPPRRSGEFRKACARLAQAAREAHRITTDPGWTASMRQEADLTGASWRDLRDAVTDLQKATVVIERILSEQQQTPPTGGGKKK